MRKILLALALCVLSLDAFAASSGILTQDMSNPNVSNATGILPVVNGGTGTTFATNSNIFAWLGDSRVAQMFNDGGGTSYPANTAHVKTNQWFNTANALLGQRMKIAYEGGISGDTCPQWSTNLSAAIATNASIVGQHGLVNDIAQSGMTGSNTAAQILASSQSIWSCEQTNSAKILAAGRKVLLIGEPGAQNFTATQVAQTHQINELIREYAANTPGVYYFPLQDYLWNPVGSTNPTTAITFCTSCSVDGTHLNTLGHWIVGQAFATFWSPLLPPMPSQTSSANEIPANGNVQQLVNQLFTTTTGGTLGTGFTGNMPSGYGMFVTGSPTGTVSTVADPSGFGNDLVINITFTASTDLIRIFQGTTIGNFTVPGDFIEGGAEYVVDPATTVLGGVSVQVGQFSSQSNNQTDLFPYNTAPYPATGIDFVEKTAPLTVLTGTTAITWYTYIYPTGAGTVKITIKRPWLRRKFAL